MIPVNTTGFDVSGGIALVVRHTFDAAKDGQLLHYIDDVLRATVPPEGWDDYEAQYPAAGEILAQLRNPPKAKR